MPCMDPSKWQQGVDGPHMLRWTLERSIHLAIVVMMRGNVELAISAVLERYKSHEEMYVGWLQVVWEWVTRLQGDVPLILEWPSLVRHAKQSAVQKSDFNSFEAVRSMQNLNCNHWGKLLIHAHTLLLLRASAMADVSYCLEPTVQTSPIILSQQS